MLTNGLLWTDSAEEFPAGNFESKGLETLIDLASFDAQKGAENG